MAAKTSPNLGLLYGRPLGDGPWDGDFNLIVKTLDALLAPKVLSLTLATPPTNPAEGDCYIVAVGGTGVWTGKDNYFAYYINAAWMFFAPKEGIRVKLHGGGHYECDGTLWNLLSSSGNSSGSGSSSGSSSSSVVTASGVLAPAASVTISHGADTLHERRCGFSISTTVKIIPTLTSRTTPSGYTASSSTNYNSGAFPEFQAFDHSINTFWASNGFSGDEWVQIQVPQALFPYVYVIQSRADGSTDQAPISWTVKGSNDGGNTFTVLDTRTSQPAWTAGETRSYSISNPGSYTTFRLEITANAGSGIAVSVASFDLCNLTYTEVAISDPQSPQTNTVWVQEGDANGLNTTTNTTFINNLGRTVTYSAFVDLGGSSGSTSGTGNGSSVSSRITPVIKGVSHAGGNSPLSVPLPLGSAVGDYAILFIATGDGFSGITGWNTKQIVPGTGWSGGICYKVLTSADISSGFAVVNYAGNYTNLGMIVVLEGSTASAISNVFAYNSGGSAPFSGDLFSSTPNALFIGVGTNRAGDSTNVATVGATSTSSQIDTYSYGSGSITAYQASDPSGEVLLTFNPTDRGSYDFIYILIAVVGPVTTTSVTATTTQDYFSPIDAPPSTANAFDDEFNGTILNPAWTWVNQTSGGATASATVGGGSLVIQDNVIVANGNGRFLVKPIPTSDFDIISKVFLDGMYSFNNVGLTLYDSTTGNWWILRLVNRTNGMDARPGYLYGNDLSSMNGTEINVSTDLTGGGYLRIKRVGTTYTLMFSAYGYSWITVASAAFPYSNPPDSFGLYYCNFSNSSNLPAGIFKWIRRVA